MANLEIPNHSAILVLPYDQGPTGRVKNVYLQQTKVARRPQEPAVAVRTSLREDEQAKDAAVRAAASIGVQFGTRGHEPTLHVMPMLTENGHPLYVVFGVGHGDTRLEESRGYVGGAAIGLLDARRRVGEQGKHGIQDVATISALHLLPAAIRTRR